jgi:hypothetical protein
MFQIQISEINEGHILRRTATTFFARLRRFSNFEKVNSDLMQSKVTTDGTHQTTSSADHEK